MSEQSVKVSIIIPIYNNEMYLYDTLLSIQKQTFPDFEVIIVTDGSKEENEKIINQFVDSDKRFVKINQDNKENSKARKNVLGLAKGEYITFVDGDDTIPTNALQEMDNVARNYQPDLIVGGIQRVDGSVKKVDEKIKNLKYKRDLGKEDLVHDLSMCNKWFKKSVIDEHNLRLESARELEDGVFLHSFLSCADEICYCDAVVYNDIKRVPIQEGKIPQHVEEKPVKKPSLFVKAKRAVKRILRKFVKHKEVQDKIKTGTAVLDYYFNCEVDEHVVLLEGIGKHVKGNILYIIRELQKEKYSDYKLYVSVKEDNKKQVELFLKQQGIEGVNLVVVESKKYKELLATAKYLFNEVYYPNYWVQKPEQCSVNIWHGTPLKKLGVGKSGKKIHGNGPAQRNFVGANYMLFPNEYTREHLLRDRYVDELMMGDALLLGYPRTGRLLETIGEEETLRERLAGDKKQLIAYMPTFRDGDKDGKQIEKILDLFECVEQELPEDSLMYVNLHHKMNGQIDYNRYSKIKQFPADLETYQVLTVVDCLCTDYSSILFDFAVTRRKIVLYCYDLEEYITSRGVYLDMEELPFAKVRTAQEAVQAFQKEKQYDDSDFLEKFCKYDSKDNAAKLCECVIGGSRECIAPGKAEEVLKPILIYSDGWHPSCATDLMYQLAENETWAKKIYLSYHAAFVDNYLNSAYPLLFKFRSMGTKGDQLFTDEQKKVKSLYRAEKISFEEMLSELEISYKTERHRCYDRLPFEKMILWDTMNPDKIIGYSYFECDKYLFIQDGMWKEINRGNRYFCDAVKHFVNQGGKIMVSDVQAQKYVKDQLNMEAFRIENVNDIEKILN